MSDLGDEVPWKGLHPLSLAINLLPRTLAVVRNLWPLFLALWFGAGSGGLQGEIIDAGIVVVFLLLTVGGTVVHFLTLRYRVAEGRLEIVTGLLNRQVRVISPDRVQNIERVQNLLHRATGMVEVRIETASGGDVEGLLSALTNEDAQDLIDQIEGSRRDVPDLTDEAALPTIVVNDLTDLFKYGITASRLGATAVLAGLLLEGLQVTDPARIEEVSGVLGVFGALALIMVAVTGTWLVGTATTVVRYWDFRLFQKKHSLVAESGLFTRRRVELPLDKVQLVTLTEPWLRRLVGFGSLSIETAAVRPEGDGFQQSEAHVPVLDGPDQFQAIRRAVPQLTVDPLTAELLPPHPKALIRSVAAGSGRTAAVAAVVGWWFFPWGLLAFVMVPIMVVVAWLDHKHQGWLVTDHVVIARRGYLSRRTWILPRDKLQSLFLQDGPILRRYGLGRLALRVAGSSVVLPDLAWDHASGLQQRLTHGEPRDTA